MDDSIKEEQEKRQSIRPPVSDFEGIQEYDPSGLTHEGHVTLAAPDAETKAIVPPYELLYDSQSRYSGYDGNLTQANKHRVTRKMTLGNKKSRGPAVLRGSTADSSNGGGFNILALLTKVFNDIDHNGNGHICTQELYDAYGHNPALEEMIKYFDGPDGDTHISFEEWGQGIQNLAKGLPPQKIADLLRFLATERLDSLPPEVACTRHDDYIPGHPKHGPPKFDKITQSSRGIGVDNPSSLGRAKMGINVLQTQGLANATFDDGGLAEEGLMYVAEHLSHGDADALMGDNAAVATQIFDELGGAVNSLAETGGDGGNAAEGAAAAQESGGVFSDLKDLIETMGASGLSSIAEEINNVTSEMKGTVKILASHLQILSSLEFTLEIPWPSIFKNFTLSMAFVNLEMFEIIPAGCIVSPDYYMKFLAAIIFPALAVIVVVVVSSGIAYRMRGTGNAKAARQASDFGYKVFFLLTYLMYPSVSAEVLRIFACDNVGGEPVLRADMRLKCYDDKWTVYSMVAIFALFLYPFGIPAFYFMCLYRARHLFHTEECQAKLGFLFDQYEYDKWYWEIVEMGRKLILTGCIIFFLPGSISQIAFALLVSSCFLTAHVKLQAYLYTDDDLCMSSAMFAATITLFVGILLKAQDDPDAQTGNTEVGKAIMGFLLVAINAMVIVLAIYCAVWVKLLPSLRIFHTKLRTMWDHAREVNNRKKENSGTSKGAPEESDSILAIAEEEALQDALQTRVDVFSVVFEVDEERLRQEKAERLEAQRAKLDKKKKKVDPDDSFQQYWQALPEKHDTVSGQIETEMDRLHHNAIDMQEEAKNDAPAPPVAKQQVTENPIQRAAQAAQTASRDFARGCLPDFSATEGMGLFPGTLSGFDPDFSFEAPVVAGLERPMGAGPTAFPQPGRKQSTPADAPATHQVGINPAFTLQPETTDYWGSQLSSPSNSKK
jgi:hypothetical protein